MNRRIFFLMPLACSSVALAVSPFWTNENTQERKGNLYRAVCTGTGPSLDLARREAQESCQYSAMQQLGTNVSAKSKVVETEKDLIFHREVEENASYSGLTCQPGRENIESAPSQFKVWIECTFDLSKAKAQVENPEPKEALSNSGAILNRGELENADKTIPAKTGKYLASNRTTIFLSVIPSCDELIVSGKNVARVVKCEADPVTITLDPEDREITVRADGYISKTVRVKPKGGDENVQVFLDAKD